MDLLAPVDLYCERLTPEFWAEPWNALSNLFIFIAGAVFWKKSGWIKFFSVIAMLTGIGSFLFHTFAQTWSMICDVAPISIFIFSYAYFSFVFVAKYSSKKSALLVFIILFANALIELFVAKSFLNGSTSYLPAFAVLIFIWRQALQKQMPESRWFGVSVVVLMCSLFARTLDHFFCPELPIGTHFLWHSFNGLLLFILIRNAESITRSPYGDN